MNIYLLIALSIYSFIIIAIGVFFYYRTKTYEQFSLGGRKTNYFVTAIATQASDMSSWLMLGFPAAVYISGIKEVATAFGLITFMFISWHYIALRIRKKTYEHNVHTLSGLFALSFKGKYERIIRLVSAIITIFFFTCYITSSIVALGRVLESFFFIPYQYSIIFATILSLLYTLMGGFLSVSWSNMFQGCFLLSMIILVPLTAFFNFDITYPVISLHMPTLLELIKVMFLAIGWGCGYFGQPHILTYFMGIDNIKNIQYAKYIGMIWQITALAGAASMGLIARHVLTINITNPEMIFVVFAQNLFHPLMVGFVLCAIIAAALTTISSHILIAGSVFTSDIYQLINKDKKTANQLINLSRIFSLSLCLLALFFSWDNSNTIYNLVNYAWSGLGAAFGPLVLAIIYDINISPKSALIGLCLGSFISGLWPLLGINILPLIPGFMIHACWLLFRC